MRLKISLSSKGRNFLIPYNYNYIISSMIYKKIADIDLASKLHSSEEFKYFTFSQIYVPQRKTMKDGIVPKNGKFHLYISSPNDYLIKSLVEGYLEDPEVIFKGKRLLVEQVELLKKPQFKGKMRMKTISPVVARIKREVDGKLKVWDLGPADERFYENLEKNLLNKYISFYGDYDGDNVVKITPNMKSAKRRRIAIEKGDNVDYHRGYMMHFDIEADPRLIEFAYDCGLGEKNSMGFGCLDVYPEKRGT